MNFVITILGSGAAIPTSERNPSAQLVEAGGYTLLFDCAEGTQLQLRKYKKRFSRISHIFISHLHGDHYFGLMGLLTTFHLLGRKEKLHLFANQALEDILNIHFKHSKTVLNYPLVIHYIEADKTQVIVDNKDLQISSIPLIHSIPTTGFLIREKQAKRKIRKSFVSKQNIPLQAFEGIKNGDDYIDETGQVHHNVDITHEPPKPKSYAYITDTAYNESIVPAIKGVDVLYHEATFMNDKASDATDKMHATASQAAAIALKAEAGKLVLGHYSARYKDLSLLLEEAKSIFTETILGEDGLVITID